MQLDREVLTMALVGYEAARRDLDGIIAKLRAHLGGHNGQPHTRKVIEADPKYIVRTPKRTMSAAARKRIAAAQRRRWKAYHREQGRAA